MRDPAQHQEGREARHDDLPEMIGHQRPEPRAGISQRHAQSPRQHRRGEIAVHHFPKAHFPLHPCHLDGVEGAEHQREGVKTQGPDKRRTLVIRRDRRGEKLQQADRKGHDACRYEKHGDIVPLVGGFGLHQRAVDAVVNEHEGEVYKDLQNGDLTEDLRREQAGQHNADDKPDQLDGEALCELVEQGTDNLSFFHGVPLSGPVDLCAEKAQRVEAAIPQQGDHQAVRHPPKPAPAAPVTGGEKRAVEVGGQNALHRGDGVGSA